ncbi:sodium/potassium/calcium exchanger 4-like [Clavelina lepadiformis]|uniref:sodium/potassium/calcium exchanger 4-like n=1 Tax=Clavelina lepadiformis TaxID=159417 RepID=UPI00404200A1
MECHKKKNGGRKFKSHFQTSAIKVACLLVIFVAAIFAFGLHFQFWMEHTSGKFFQSVHDAYKQPNKLRENGDLKITGRTKSLKRFPIFSKDPGMIVVETTEDWNLKSGTSSPKYFGNQLSRPRRSVLSHNRHSIQQTNEVLSNPQYSEDNRQVTNDISIDTSNVNSELMDGNTDNLQSFDQKSNPADSMQDLVQHSTRLEVYEATKKFCTYQLLNRTLSNHTTSRHEEEVNEGHDECKRERESGLPALWTTFYIFIVFFLFIALAIICDEFFVPSLEAISEKLNLSEDVAGATFMAAGSSAPELFTSIAGVGTGSDVGVGTIVGSAVFNLLVIIALTSALAGQILTIDWRPLIRDSVFYGFSIVIFILFSWDATFQWWESLLLLLLYVLYCVTMKYNPQLMNYMESLPCCSCFNANNNGKVSPNSQEVVESPVANVEQQGEPDDMDNRAATSQNVIIDETPCTSSPKTTLEDARKPITRSETCVCTNRRCCCCHCCYRCCCVCQEATTSAINKELKVNELVGCKETKEIEQDYENVQNPGQKLPTTLDDQLLCNECSETKCYEETIKELPGEDDNFQSSACCSSQPSLGVRSKGFALNWSVDVDLEDKASSGQLNCISRNMQPGSPPSYHDLAVSKNTSIRTKFSSYFRRHLRRKQLKCLQHAEKSSSTTSNRHQKQGQNKILEETVSYTEEKNGAGLKEGVPELTAEQNADLQVNMGNMENFRNIAVEEIVHSALPDSEPTAEENNEVFQVFPCLPPIRHPPPEKPDSSHCVPSAKYIGQWAIYGLSFPWICAYTWTIPDCSKPENRKWYLASFVASILWIAGISYFMVEVVEIVGCLLHIDTYTMGLVVIAVGTSVPDAISSVLVAREGYGDMAVSNAIGSNVFDINLGLGLPFLIGSIITSKPVQLLTPLQNCLLNNLPLQIPVIPHVKFGLILLTVLLICLLMFFAVRFRLNRTVGYVFVAMYVGFMIYAFVQEKLCFGFFC